MKILKNIQSEIEKLKAEYKTYKKILKKYSDVSDNGTTRWNKNLLISNLAKKDMVEVDFTHFCGCCADSTLYAMPYVEIEGKKIYAQPIQYEIGQAYALGIGEEPLDNWEQELKKNGFRDEIIRKVKKYFEDHLPEAYDDDDWEVL